MSQLALLSSNAGELHDTEDNARCPVSNAQPKFLGNFRYTPTMKIATRNFGAAPFDTAGHFGRSFGFRGSAGPRKEPHQMSLFTKRPPKPFEYCDECLSCSWHPREFTSCPNCADLASFRPHAGTCECCGRRDYVAMSPDADALLCYSCNNHTGECA